MKRVLYSKTGSLPQVVLVGDDIRSVAELNRLPCMQTQSGKYVSYLNIRQAEKLIITNPSIKVATDEEADALRNEYSI